MKNTSRHILITRPKDRAPKLAHALTQAGFAPVVFPTVEIHPVKPATLAKCVALAKHASKIIFMSPAAVIHGLAALKAHDVTMPSDVDIFAVGPETAEALKEAGITVTRDPQPPFNSEALCALPELRPLSIIGQEILIIRGRGGKEILPEYLKGYDVKVDLCEVYERLLPNYTASAVQKAFADWQSSGLDAIICSSLVCAKNLFELLGKAGHAWLQNQIFVVVSEPDAAWLKEQGVKGKPIIAKDASIAALVEAVRCIND